jgi:hypothetical protein
LDKREERSDVVHWLMTLALAADVGTAAILDGDLTAAELQGARDGARGAGFTVLEDTDVRAAVDALAVQGITCASDDVLCVAKIALLAEAEAVITFVHSPAGLEVRAVDAGPRMGVATALTSSSDDVSRATSSALAARAPLPLAMPSPPPERTPAPTPAPVPDTRALDAGGPRANATNAHTPNASARASTAPEPSALRPAWSLAGAGLAGAGLVALAAGGYAAALATDSMQSAEGARFQDDAARFGDEANTRLWLGGGALALGVGAVAGGAALVFGGGP